MAAERREAALCFFHADQDVGIGRPRAGAKMTDDGFIAGQLQIPVGQHVHHPDQRVEPVRTGRSGQQELEEHVEPANMDKFMLQHVGKRRFIVPIRLFWH